MKEILEYIVIFHGLNVWTKTQPRFVNSVIIIDGYFEIWDANSKRIATGFGFSIFCDFITSIAIRVNTPNEFEMLWEDD